MGAVGWTFACRPSAHLVNGEPLVETAPVKHTGALAQRDPGDRAFIAGDELRETARLRQDGPATTEASTSTITQHRQRVP